MCRSTEEVEGGYERGKEIEEKIVAALSPSSLQIVHSDR
jgi:hypothetical protein